MCLCLAVCSFHDTVIVLVAMGMTAAICLSLTIFAIQTKVSSLSLRLYSVTLVKAAAIGQVSPSIRSLTITTIKHAVSYRGLKRDKSYHCGSQSSIFTFYSINQSINLYRAIVQRRVLQCGYAESKRNVLRRILTVLLHVLSKHYGIYPIFAKFGTRIKCIVRINLFSNFISVDLA